MTFDVQDIAKDIAKRPFILVGFLGFVFVSLGCEPAPLILGFVLGRMMEENLRRALLLSRGDFSVFVTRPISLVLLLMAFAMLNAQAGGVRHSQAEADELESGDVSGVVPIGVPLWLLLFLRLRSEETWLIGIAFSAGLMLALFVIFRVLLRIGPMSGSVITWFS